MRLGLAVLLIAAALAWPFPRDNENRTLDLLRAIAHGKLTIDRDAHNTIDTSFVLGTRASGAALALSGVAPASILSGEHVYSGGAPGLALALAPVHLVARRALPEGSRGLVWLLTLVGAGLPLALGAVAIRRATLALGASESLALVAALTHALGTIALPFATRLYAHSLVIALLAWSLALLVADEPRPGDAKKTGDAKPGASRALPRAALAGLLAAAAFTCDYSAGLPAAVLGLMALARGGLRGAIAFALGAIPPALALGAYHDACFGSPFSLPYDHRLDTGTRALLATGAYGFVLPKPVVIAHLLAGPRRGILLCEPAALLGLVGLVASLRDRRPQALALLAAVGVFLANAARSHDWTAGFSFGPRYATAALPFLALGYPRAIALLGRASVPVLAASALMALLGATTDWTFSLVGTLEIVWNLGLHEGVVLELALAIAAAALLLAPRGRVVRWAALALVPLALEAPAACQRLYSNDGAHEHADGRPSPRQAALFRELDHRERFRSVAWAIDADEARGRAENARFGWGDPILYYVALRRLVELAPEDEEARAELLRVRGELDKAAVRPGDGAERAK